jgi:hypothetical protein
VTCVVEGLLEHLLDLLRLQQGQGRLLLPGSGWCSLSADLPAVLLLLLLPEEPKEEGRKAGEGTVWIRCSGCWNDKQQIPLLCVFLR